MHSQGVVGGPSSAHPVHVHTPQASVAPYRRLSSQRGALRPHPSPRSLRLSHRSLSLRISSRAGRQISAPPGKLNPTASQQLLQTTSVQRGIRPAVVSRRGLPTGGPTGGLPRLLRLLMADRGARLIRGETPRRLWRLPLPRRPITLRLRHLLRPRKTAVRWDETWK